MSLLEWPQKWLQKIGTTGSIARWAYKNYRITKSLNPRLPEAEICKMLWDARYYSMPPKGEAKRKLEEFVKSGSSIKSLLDLCYVIAEIELDVSTMENMALWRRRNEVIIEELERLGYSPPLAETDLGSMYYSGEGVEKDDAKAFSFYSMAAEQGNAQAQFNLGRMYEKGEGIEKDDKEAFKWVHMAAEQGHAEAQNALGLIFYKGEGITPQNFDEAFKWTRKAAEQGHVDSQYNLGVLYNQGKGVTQNTELAIKWYREAADQGNASAQEKLKTLRDS